MKTTQITGLGPVAADGSVELFTVEPHPFKVTKEWLAAQAAYPAVGDELFYAEDGTLTMTSATKVEQEQEKTPTAEEAPAEKKTGLSIGSQLGAELSPLPSYTAKPTVIYAGKITGVQDGQFVLENGQLVSIHNGVGVGDYWVEDGKTTGYIPAAEFDRLFVAN